MKAKYITKDDAIHDICIMLRDCFGADEEELEAVKITIGEMAAEDVAPVSHSGWTQVGQIVDIVDIAEFKCKKCGRSFLIAECDGVESYHFCPSCGADMREVKMEYIDRFAIGIPSDFEIEKLNGDGYTCMKRCKNYEIWMR